MSAMKRKRQFQNDEQTTEVFVWGADRYGQLGLGSRQVGRCYCVPRFCIFNIVISKIACGEEHAAFLTEKGHVFTMGSNADGRLGIGDKSVKISSTPCLVESLSSYKAVDIACGWGHTAAVINSGELFTWGVSEHGALGVMGKESQWFPIKVNFPEDNKILVKSVSCGTRHTAIVDHRGALHVCGAGDAGQLGTGSREKLVIPTHVEALQERVMQSACGIFHTLVLTELGVVYSMGGNNFGQLGIGTKRSSTLPVVVKGLEKERIVKIAAGHASAALNDKGIILLWGTNIFGEYLLPTKLKGIKSKIKDVDLGGTFGIAIDTMGQVYSWGSNSSGELATGDFEPRASPEIIEALKEKVVTQIACGGSFSLALGETICQEAPPMEAAISEKDCVQTPIRPSEHKEHFQSTYTDYKGRMRDKSPFDPNKDNLQTELLEALHSEKQKAREAEKAYTTLKHKLEEIQHTMSPEYQANVFLENEHDDTTQYKERLILEQSISELKAQIESVRAENTRLRSTRHNRTIEKNSRFDTLLEEYQKQIQTGTEECQSLEREKNEEIKELNKEIEEEKSKIALLQEDLIQEPQNSTLKKLEIELEKGVQEISSIHNERDMLLTQQTEIENHKNELSEELNELHHNIDLQESELQRKNTEIELKKAEVLDNEEKLLGEKRRFDDLRAELQEKEISISQTATDLKDQEASEQEEIEQSNGILSDIEKKRNELLNQLQEKQTEIDALTKRINLCKVTSDETRQENAELKRKIQELENKNRKILDRFNSGNPDKMSFYKENKRMFSEHPTGTQRIGDSSRPNFLITSPTRFDSKEVEERKYRLSQYKEISETVLKKPENEYGIFPTELYSQRKTINDIELEQEKINRNIPKYSKEMHYKPNFQTHRLESAVKSPSEQLLDENDKSPFGESIYSAYVNHPESNSKSDDQYISYVISPSRVDSTSKKDSHEFLTPSYLTESLDD